MFIVICGESPAYPVVVAREISGHCKFIVIYNAPPFGRPLTLGNARRAHLEGRAVVSKDRQAAASSRTGSNGRFGSALPVYEPVFSGIHRWTAESAAWANPKRALRILPTQLFRHPLP
jgi:hypothetical protein